MKATLFKHTNGFDLRWQDESTYRLFPFYVHQCLRISTEDPFDLVCEKCGYNEEGNRVVKCGYFVFYDTNTVKVYCSSRCLPVGVIEYSNQVYGYRKPVELPEHLHSSLLHSTVWGYMYDSDKYKLNKYLGKNITVEFLQTEFSNLFPTYSGYSGPGTNCILNQNGYITITKNIYVGSDIDGSEEVNEARSIKHAKKSKDDPEGLILKITPSMMAAVIDEIVKPRQLLMF